MANTTVDDSIWQTSWFAEMTTEQRRTFWASFWGLATDGMDILLYSFMIPTLIALWGLSRADAGILATSALLVSALGGWCGGILADRFGRVRMLQITVLWFSIFTALCGLTNSFEQLLVVRALQGFGFGAEYAIGAALIGEIVNPKHRGKAVGSVHSAWAIGWALAAILYAASYSLFPDTMAWRVLFFVGICPALLVVYLRRNVKESPLYLQSKGASRSVMEIFSPGVLRITVLTAVLASGCQGGYYAIMTWLPTYLKTVRELSVLNTSGYLAVIIFASWVGYMMGAYLADALGRRLNFLLFSVCSVATVVLYMIVPVNNTWMLVLGFPLGFFASGTYSGIGAYLTELFPTRLRGSGMGFSYNFGRAIGALFPTLVGYLSASTTLAVAITVFTSAAYALILVAIAFLPETKGRRLTAD